MKTHISRLRNKLRDIPEFRIVTIKGLGYKAEITKEEAAMKKRRPWRNRTLAFWLSIESVVVTLVTVAPFAMLHILDRFHWLRASTVSVLGILAVMGLVVGITATLFSRQFNRMVSGLTRGLKAVADGDFPSIWSRRRAAPPACL